MSGRGTDSDETIRLRLNNARKEMTETKHYDYLVINDILDETIAQVIRIIDSEENKVVRYKNIKDTFYGG